MQQVMYANGKLWGALDTALNPDGGAAAGRHRLVHRQSVGSGKIVIQGYLGATGLRLHVSGDRRHRQRPRRDGVHRDRRHDSTRAPPTRRSTRMAGVGAWNVVAGGQGAATDDGFTSYKAQVGNPPRTRWGDYGAAAVDGNSIWIASEYIAHACDYTTWGGPFFAGGTGDNLLGTCARRKPRARHAGRARQLVDADQQVHPVSTGRTTNGGPVPRPALRVSILVSGYPGSDETPAHRRHRRRRCCRSCPAAAPRPSSGAGCMARSRAARSLRCAWPSSPVRLPPPAR